MNAVKAHLTPELIIKASSFLGEDKNGTCKAISGILPTVLSGIVLKSSSSSLEAKEVFNMAQESDNTGFLGSIKYFFEDGGALLRDQDY